MKLPIAIVTGSIWVILGYLLNLLFSQMYTSTEPKLLGKGEFAIMKNILYLT